MAGGNSIIERVIGAKLPLEGKEVTLRDVQYVLKDGILRQMKLIASVQQDMANFYDVHWKLPGAYDYKESDDFQRDLFRVMFPGFEALVALEVKKATKVLDIGCGSGVAGRTFFRSCFDRIEYVGVDMSSAIEQARDDFKRFGVEVGLLQAELNTLPFADGTFDFIFCPGVLHYTTDMHEAIGSLARVLKRGGYFVSWIYKKQKPIRHLTDAFLRSVISKMSPEAAYKAVEPLTKLGIALGQIKEELEIPEDIPYLGVKKGTYNLQRFFYYHIMKLFYSSELPFTRHVVNNWNAYYPKHVLFLAPEMIRSYFEASGFEFVSWTDQGNGVGVVVRKK